MRCRRCKKKLPDGQGTQVIEDDEWVRLCDDCVLVEFYGE